MNQPTQTLSPPLVPGRECGACSACCVNLLIDSEDLQKPANIECPNLTPVKGCAIYGSRPSDCRSFHCGWRMLAGLGDEWRPDRSRVMIRVEQDGIVLEGLGSMQPILAKAILKFIGTCVGNGVTVFINIPGKPGHTAAKLELNQALASATTGRQCGAVMRELVKAVEYGIPTAPLAPMTYSLKRVMARGGRQVGAKKR